MPPPPGARTRDRNPRGQGQRLAAEITDAALRVVEQSGSDAGVTLRAVAREAGIAAPSIYAHFADREAILLALTRQLFEELRLAIVEAVDAAADEPVARLLAGCRGYLTYGLEHPARYRVLFAPASELPTRGDRQPGDLTAIPAGAATFGVLVDGVAACIAAGRSASEDPFADAAAIWVALHGFVELRRALPGFPWPEQETLLDAIVARVARIAQPAR